MPYFRCERCALRWYSAAPETRCSECSAPLGRGDHLLEATPLPRPARDPHPIRERSWDTEGAGSQ